MQTEQRNVEAINDTRPAQSRPNVKKGIEDGKRLRSTRPQKQISHENYFILSLALFKRLLTA